MTATAEKEAPSANAPNPTPEIALDTSADYALVTREMKNAAEALKKVADKVNDAGYPREARRIRQDADQITMRIVPRFQPQVELNMEPDGLSLEEQIERMLLDDVRRAMQACFAGAKSHAKAEAANDKAAAQGKKTTLDVGEFDFESHVTRLSKKLSLRIAQFGHECAERGVTAGMNVREIEEGDVVERAIAKLAPEQES